MQMSETLKHLNIQQHNMLTDSSNNYYYNIIKPIYYNILHFDMYWSLHLIGLKIKMHNKILFMRP